MHSSHFINLTAKFNTKHLIVSSQNYLTNLFENRPNYSCENVQTKYVSFLCIVTTLDSYQFPTIHVEHGPIHYVMT